MKILGFNLSITRSTPQPSTKSLSPASAAWLTGRDVGPIRTRLDNPFHRVAWLYRAASVLAEQIANIPFLFSRGERGREHLITSGPLLDFYDHPHPHINRFQYWELRVLWLLLRGECFRVPIYERATAGSPSPGGEGRGEGGISSQRSTLCLTGKSAPRSNARRLKHVLILNPDNFQEIVENHQLLGWRYTGFSHSTPLESQIFLPEEVWHDKLPDPFNFWRGLSPLSAADVPARADFAAGNFMRGLMENNGDIGLIVRTTDPLSDEQKEQILGALRARKNGAGVADQPLLLWNSCEIVKPTLSAADMQFLENRKFSRAEICAALGVPEEIVSSTDHNKYDVMQGARLNFIENRVAPLCARLEADENNTTIPALTRSYDGETLSSHGPSIQNSKSKIQNPLGWFDLDSLPIMQQARRNRLAAAKTGFDMGVPVNDLNRLLDLGLPDLPWGNTGFLPSNLQALPSASASASAPLSAPGGEGRGEVVRSAPATLSPRDSQRLFNLLESALANDPSELDRLINFFRRPNPDSAAVSQTKAIPATTDSPSTRNAH